MSIQEISDLNDQLVESRKEIRTDRLDMSFGEIINMYNEDEIIISPEFQRAFRWDVKKQTKFIESILLGIPIPPIFVAETNQNIWELVDGLQRMSTVLSFFGYLKDDDKNNLILEGGTILKGLEGHTINSIPLSFKLLIKRAVCRIEVIRFDSEYDMRYELFNRLNTGGVLLSNQEIRNCIFRMYDNTFNAFLKKLSDNELFRKYVSISESDKESMYYQELVLRYFTIKNRGAKFKENIQEHMDSYMLEISKNESKFDYIGEDNLFNRVLKLLKDLDSNVFKLSKLTFSTSMYDAIMICFANNIDYLETLKIEDILDLISRLKKDEEFKKATGAASSSQYRIGTRIEIANHYFSSK